MKLITWLVLDPLYLSLETTVEIVMSLLIPNFIGEKVVFLEGNKIFLTETDFS